MLKPDPIEDDAYEPEGFCPHCSYPSDPGTCPECGGEVSLENILSDPTENKFKFSDVGWVILVCVVGTALMLVGLVPSLIASLPFLLWVVLPYGIILLLARALGRRASRKVIVVSTMATCGIMFVFSMLVYVDALFFNTSSTSVLVLLFIPLYMLVGGPIIFVLCLLVGRRLKRYGQLQSRFVEEDD